MGKLYRSPVQLTQRTHICTVDFITYFAKTRLKIEVKIFTVEFEDSCDLDYLFYSSAQRYSTLFHRYKKTFRSKEKAIEFFKESKLPFHLESTKVKFKGVLNV